MAENSYREGINIHSHAIITCLEYIVLQVDALNQTISRGMVNIPRVKLRGISPPRGDGALLSMGVRSDQARCHIADGAAIAKQDGSIPLAVDTWSQQAI